MQLVKELKEFTLKCKGDGVILSKVLVEALITRLTRLNQELLEARAYIVKLQQEAAAQKYKQDVAGMGDVLKQMEERAREEARKRPPWTVQTDSIKWLKNDEYNNNYSKLINFEKIKKIIYK